MRILGLLSFYDEPPELLAASIASLQEHMGVEHLVAVDGRYALYDGEFDVSPPNQHAAIVMACKHVGMGCTLHVPTGAWDTNETGKRSFLFALAHAVSEPGDWFMVQDADQLIIESPADLREQLAATECDAADVTFIDVEARRMGHRAPMPERFEVRLLYRRQAEPIRVVKYHGRYMTADGRMLWHATERDLCEPGLDLRNKLVGEHRPNRRDQMRQLAKQNYYANRDAAAIEMESCACGAPARQRMTTHWRMVSGRPVADTRDCCTECAAVVEKENVRKLAVMGIDASKMIISEYYGRPLRSRPLPLENPTDRK